MSFFDHDPADGDREPPAGSDSRPGGGRLRLRRQVKSPFVPRELLPNQSPKLLRELHLLTASGNLNADALRKLKQVNHLVGLLRPALEEIWSRFEHPVLVDAGSGNSYLGFILYE